ncbi:hypothetical protein pb186bvf_002099 [Paramecium bursaria]
MIMNLVDENGDVITQAKFEFSEQIKTQDKRDYFKKVGISQEQKYFATFWEQSDHIKFWKNQVKLKSLQMKKGRQIQTVKIQNSLMLVLLNGDLYIYNNKSKLINKSQNLNISDNTIAFTVNKKIIFQKNCRVLTYDFVKKNYTFYDWTSISNTFGYCPINDVILIPSEDQQVHYIRAWSVAKYKMITQIKIKQLKRCQIKMSKSGKYFIVKEYYDGVVYVYEYGERITYMKKLYQFYPCQMIEWILDDKYLLNYSFTQFEIQNIEKDQKLDCKLYDLEAVTQQSIKNDLQDMEKHKKQIYLYKKIQRPMVLYYSIML